MDILKKIEGFITAPLEGLGYEIVQILISGKHHWRVLVMIDRLDGHPVGMDDCVRASRLISATLDVEDPIENPYTLEVSSPGLDRPLIKRTDYQRFQGKKVKLQLYQPQDGRRKFVGVLQKADEDSILVVLEEDAQEVRISYDEIRQAKIVPEF